MSDNDNPFGEVTEEAFQQQLNGEGKKAIGKSKRAKEREAKAAAKAAKLAEQGAAPVAEKTPQAPAEPKYCLCGCGRQRGAKAFFIPGHDSTAKSRLLKIDRGQIPVPEGGIDPELLAYSDTKWSAKLPDLHARLDGTFVELEPEEVAEAVDESIEELPEGETPAVELDPDFEGYPGSNQ